MDRLDTPHVSRSKRLQRAESVFAMLLLMYPALHRRRFDQEMRQTFRDLYLDHVRKGHNSMMFWSGLIFDTARAAARDRINVIRSSSIMKTYIKNTASRKSLLWGVALMMPIPLMLVTTIIYNALDLQFLSNVSMSTTQKIGFVVQVILPLIALGINLAALVRSAHAKSMPFTSRAAVTRYLWTFIFIAATFVWIIFIFGPLAFNGSY